MCGIFGWILPAHYALDERTLVDLTSMLSHRGPDGSGYWLNGTADNKFQIGLGHRRLAIIDLSDNAAQPMSSADRNVIVTFNGEIYNYVELRNELRTLGHTFRTNSDTEVLIEAYRAWGDEALPRLRGMFAFVIFDRARQRALFARDPFGKKPLYIVKNNSSILFSSEICNLIKAPGVDRSLDWDALGEYLVDRYAPGPATMFRSIRKLPPGSLAVWENGRWTERRYFLPPLSLVRPDIKNFKDAVRLFQAAFDDAVRVRLRSDAPFGAYLSGGIDSSAVVATMTRHLSGTLRTFSVGFAMHGYSELEYARTVAEHFATDHHELVVRPDDYFESWPDALTRRGAPVSEPADIPILLLSEAARSTVKMVLTGEGSDELLAGYPKHVAERWVGLYQSAVPRWLHDGIVVPAANALPYELQRIKILASALGERNFRHRMRTWFGGVSSSESAAFLERSGDRSLNNNFPYSLAPGTSLRRTLFYDQTSWLPDNLLERGDRMMMAHSIEGRMPFMDTELAGVVARFHDRILISTARGKAVLREAFRQQLPAQILGRKKVGFRVPIGEWFRGQYRDMIRDLLSSAQSETLRICNGALIDRYVVEHLAGQQNHERVLWMLANLELFIRIFRPDLGGHACSRAEVSPAARHALSEV